MLESERSISPVGECLLEIRRMLSDDLAKIYINGFRVEICVSQFGTRSRDEYRAKVDRFVQELNKLDSSWAETFRKTFESLSRGVSEGQNLPANLLATEKELEQYRIVRNGGRWAFASMVYPKNSGVTN